MRNFRNRKAWIRLVEIVLAAALVFGCVTYLQHIQISDVQKPEWDTAILKTYGEDALRSFDLKDEDLDYRSDLRWWIEYSIDNGDWSGIESKISGTLQQNIAYALYFYNPTTSAWEFKGGVSESQVSDEIDKVAVWYVIAGDYGEFCDEDAEEACALKLILWFIG